MSRRVTWSPSRRDLAIGLILHLWIPASAADSPTAPDLQALLDASPGRIIEVPPGEHLLQRALVLRHPDSGLRGAARLIQSNTNASFIEARGVTGIHLSGLTLVRASGREDARTAAVVIDHCDDVTLEGLRIRDNRSAAGVIRIEDCRRVDIVRCEIRNYMTLAIDDRTASPHYGYAFRCIDGTGLVVTRSRDVLIEGNRIREDNLRPTPEMKERHGLGGFVRRAPQKGSLINQSTWDAGYVNNWHQGSALIVTGPEHSAHVRIIGNHIENAAQGIDIHADHVTILGNQVVNAFMGMKAMHGSRHVIVANNQFIRNDLWAIGFMPGTTSNTTNIDGGSVITGNLIADFGHGDSRWIWNPAKYTCAPILFDHGQEPTDPPLRDVIISGNVVMNDGAGSIADGGGPRYRWAVFISSGRPHSPRNLLFQGNRFAPGTDGVSNTPLEPAPPKPATAP